MRYLKELRDSGKSDASDQNQYQVRRDILRKGLWNGTANDAAMARMASAWESHTGDAYMGKVEEGIFHEDGILAEMVRRLVAAFDPELIYVYGSRARSEEGPDSDYDLMMVLSASSLPRYRRDQLAFRALCGIGVPKEVIVLTRKEFDSKRSVVSSLPATVEREGKLLYAA